MNKSTSLIEKTQERNREVQGRRSTQHEISTSEKTFRDKSREKYKRRRDNRKILRSSEENLSVFSKAVNDPNKPEEDSTERMLEATLDTNVRTLRGIYDEIVCNKKGVRAIIEMFPDVKMAIKILISAILSPGKLTDNRLNYRLPKDYILGLEDIKSAMLECVSLEMEDEYNLLDSLPKILYEVIASSGACPHVIINEAVVDDIVNADLLTTIATESYQEAADHFIDQSVTPIGIFTNNKVPAKSISLDDVTSTLTLESLAGHLASKDYFKLTDNTGIVNFATVRKEVRSRVIRKSVRSGAVAIEAKERLEYLSVFRDRKENSEVRRVERIFGKEKATRKGIGKPLVKIFPTESVAPVFSAGNKDHHLGYLVALNANGEPVSEGMSESSFDRLSMSMRSGGSPLTQVYKDIVQDGNGDKHRKVDLSALRDFYSGIIRDQINDSFESSIYGEYIDLTDTNSIVNIMFCRSLQAQQTVVLFIPKESLVYFSMENNDIGVGKTFLDDLKMNANMRAILLFAKVMSQVRASIDVTNIEVELDPTDPNPEQTISMVTELVTKARSDSFPLGELNPDRLTQWIRNSGVRINYTGHPAIPEMKITYDKGSESTGNGITDNELDNILSERMLTGLGVSPETVSSAYSPDFAVEILFNNAFFNRQIKTYQTQWSPEISKFVSILTYNDENLRGKLKEILIERKEKLITGLEEHEKKLLNESEDLFFEEFIDEFSRKLYVELPEVPDMNVAMTNDQFKDYVEELDSSLDILFSDDFFSEEVAGKAQMSITSVKAAMKAMLVRRWASDNNYLPELYSLLSDDEENMTILVNSVSSHFKVVSSTVTKLLDSFKESRKASDQDLTRIEKESQFKDDDDY